MIYFDHNATSQLHPAARTAWLEASEKLIGNPSSLHRLGSRADAALEAARSQLAGWIGCDPLDIVWTSGASEANNTVFHHFAQGQGQGSKEIWVSAIEHPSVLQAAKHYFSQSLRLIPVSEQGIIDLDWLASTLNKSRPLLVAVMAANNETGILQPWRDVLALCSRYEVPFFCDAVQWVGKLPSNDLGLCDFVSGSAHKFGGPKGVGFLKVPAKGALNALVVGGPQEHGRRAGTENVAGVLAMVAALEARESALATSGHLPHQSWKDTFEASLTGRLSGVQVIGKNQPRLWNTALIVMPENDCQFRWVVKLDKTGFAVSTGSACSSGEEKPSHVLTAMKYTGAEISRTIRISSGWETTEADWDALLKGIEKIASSQAGF